MKVVLFCGGLGTRIREYSESIPKPTREAMLEYVMKDVKQHRRTGDLRSATEDKAGVIIFGREATIEFLQQEYESLRRRVQALEDARARRPDAEPPEPG